MGNLLANKVAIVTGSSRGIGKAIAQAYAAEGARVAVVARTDKDGDSKLPGSIATTVKQITAAGGVAAPFHCDLTDDAQAAGMVEAVLAKFGRIDTLVNNAAIIFHTNVADTPMRRWDLIWKVNMRAILSTTG
ncbi:MAG: SDR family NAD(P)-dependent oxidoreductase, partial [SAR202 cluster bacterium]|nr:SDR family NAD(P)-dependent oxidoreductase [SAR202 cluster bacterium]